MDPAKLQDTAFLLACFKVAAKERDAALADVARLKAERDELVEAAFLLIDEIGLAIPDEPKEFDATNFWRAFAKLNLVLAKHTETRDD